MTIAEVSRKYDITPDTLRYYERIGLLPPVSRNSSGNRDYSEADGKWIQFIKCMRSAGLSIEVLIEYVSLFQQGSETAVARRSLLIEQRKQIVQKIEDLQNTLTYLDHKIDGYEGGVEAFEKGLKQF